ncbi:MAG: DUF3817 domain-containing protein [Thermomicrobiales bacterium]|nr:DUF3817 domain-containing protein [Thermomicrobiales bacterium]
MTVRNFKIVALVESISWAVLIVAMIFKYGFDREEATAIPGMVHGFLFVAFMAMLLGVTVRYGWPIARALKIFFLSLIPIGGYFLIDHSVEDAAA